MHEESGRLKARFSRLGRNRRDRKSLRKWPEREGGTGSESGVERSGAELIGAGDWGVRPVRTRTRVDGEDSGASPTTKRPLRVVR